MNLYKNEKMIKIDGAEILLRPSFENLASFEGNVITLDELSIRLIKGKLLPITMLVQAIFYFQAPNENGKREYNLEQINQMVLNSEGIRISGQVLPFLTTCMAGYSNKKEVEESTEKVISKAEKKS